MSSPLMTKSLEQMPEPFPDVLLHIFDQLHGDYATLINIGLVCRRWRKLSLPSMLHTVDISSHNDGRLPRYEFDIQPVVKGDFDDAYRPANLFTRQRAFIGLLTEKPGLANYVKSFTWTLLWYESDRLSTPSRSTHSDSGEDEDEDAGKLDDPSENEAAESPDTDEDDDDLGEIDFRTWDVFCQLNKVTRLDLAYLKHDMVRNDYVRQFPPRLFPAVTSLRLVGWMHQSLVKIIMDSIDSSKLRVLEQDWLEYEGQLSNDMPMSREYALGYAHSSRNRKADEEPNVVTDELFERQARGEACIFPGPMWLPLRKLSSSPSLSLTHLRVSLAQFDGDTDCRHYRTLFKETAALILKANYTLKSLSIVVSEICQFYESPDFNANRIHCGTTRARTKSRRPWAIKMSAEYLNQILIALTKEQYPLLESIRTEGFRIIESAADHPYDNHLYGDLDLTRQLIRECPFSHVQFTEKANPEKRFSFDGYDYSLSDSEYLQKYIPSLLTS